MDLSHWVFLGVGLIVGWMIGLWNGLDEVRSISDQYRSRIVFIVKAYTDVICDEDGSTERERTTALQQNMNVALRDLP